MKRRLKENRQTVAVLLLLVALVLLMSIFVARYHHLERQACVQRLREHTQESGRQIQDAVTRSAAYLDHVSGIIYNQYQTSEDDLPSYLSALGSVDIFSRLELLLPSGTIYTPEGPRVDPTISFSDMEKQGTGLTFRSLDQMSPNRYIVRIFTPIVRGNRTVAILCGVVAADDLGRFFPVAAYDGHTKLFLIEGKTGNYLIDSWRDMPGNLRDLDGYSFTMGYSREQCYQEIFTGQSGVTVLRAPQSTDNYYMYYSPVGVQDWMVMLAVEEDAAFAQSNSILWLFTLMFALMMALSLAFLLWFLHEVRKNQARTDLRLRGAQYMLNVQQLLFQAHTQPDRFQDALGAIADYLSADAVVYFSLDAGGQVNLRHLVGAADKAPPKNTDLNQLFPYLVQAVMAKGSFFSNRPASWGAQDKQTARNLGVRNVMLVKVTALNGEDTVGVLGAINADVLWEDAAPLDQVMLSFSMFLENYKNYQTLSYLSQVDELTGVMNRNSYQTRLEELEGQPVGSLGCIYIDANGLHEINNHLGHDAGDDMLRSVADALRSNFPRDSVFRLGGDEFAVLSWNSMSREEMERRAKKVVDTVDKCGYSVSLGFEWHDGDGLQVSGLVAAAEAAMRQNKADYYANHGGERQMRNLNTRLEQTLNAKRDADALLSYLVPSFIAVHFVDPRKDTCRSVVAPPYFEDALRDADGRFSAAFAQYIRKMVAPADQARLQDFCQYDTLLPQLKSHAAVQDITYRHADGALIRLQVKHPSRAGDDRQELMWMFTQIPQPGSPPPA